MNNDINSERIDSERIDSERIDSERIDLERIDSERIGSERIDSERIDSERIDSDWEKITTEEKIIEKKIIVSSPEEVKYNELLKEMEELKKALIAIMNLVEQQSEIIHANNDTVESVDTKIGRINSQLLEIRKKSEPSKWRYVTDYIFPLLNLTGINTPFILLFGIKSGLITFPCSYALYKIAKILGY